MDRKVKMEILASVNSGSSISDMINEYGYFTVGESLSELKKKQYICEKKDRFVLSQKGVDVLRTQTFWERSKKREDQFLRDKRRETMPVSAVYLP